MAPVSSGLSRVLIPAAVLLATALLCFLPLARHPADLLVGAHRGGQNDLTAYYLGSRDYPHLCRERFGQPPFWNPYLCGGLPYLGNPQAAFFYPPNWPFWVRGTRGLISWWLVGHHLLAGLGAYLLGRRLGASPTGGLVAGVAFLASPVLLARTAEGHIGSLGVITWSPWAFWAYERFRADAPRGGTGLIVVLALAVLAGHIQEAYYLALALTLLCLGDAARLGGTGRAGRLLLGWVLVGLGSAGLVLVELAPMMIYVRGSARGAGLFSGTTEVSSAGPASLLQLVGPFALGDLDSYRGPGTYYWESLCHFGTVPLVLAAIGLVAAVRDRQPVGRLAVVGVVSLLFAMGQNTPLYPALEALVPGVGWFRFPSRGLFLTALAVAVLAGFGAETIAAAARDRASRLRQILVIALPGLALAIAAALLAASLRLAPYLPGPPPAAPGPGGLAALRWAWGATLSRPSFWAWFGAALGVAVLAVIWPRRAAGIAALLVPLAGVELALFSQAIVRTVPPGSLRPRSPVVAALGARGDGTRILARSQALTDREAMAHQLSKVQGYEPIPLTRYLEYISAARLQADPIHGLFGFKPFDLSATPPGLLDLLGVRHVVLLRTDATPPARLGWRPLATGLLVDPVTLRGGPRRFLEYRLFEDPAALPRGFVVGEVRTPRSGEGIDAVLAAVDPRREVLLDRDVLPPGPRQAFTPARLVEDTPNRVVLEVETARPGYLILADSFYPGWSATVDGRRAAILPAYVAFRAVPLPAPGRHRVVFSYRPAGLALGALVSFLTAMVLAGTARAARPLPPGAGSIGSPLSPPS